MTTRRAVLAGGAALALVPWHARAAVLALRAALDAARAEYDPAVALRLLAPFDAARLAPGARRDLLTACAGLAVDTEIIARFGLDPRAKPPATRDPTLLTLLLRRKLRDDINIQAIAARLEQERVLCTQRAAKLFTQIGITTPTSGAGFTQLWQDARYLYPDSDAGRDTAVADMNRWLARRAAQIPILIGAVPAFCLNVTAIRPSPADIATTHVGARILPKATQTGGYIVDLTHVHHRPSWTLPSAVAHELLPGNMIQMPLEAIADPHPLRLDYAAPFVEGWGIYFEQLVAQSGGYAQDPRRAGPDTLAAVPHRAGACRSRHSLERPVSRCRASAAVRMAGPARRLRALPRRPCADRPGSDGVSLKCLPHSRSKTARAGAAAQRYGVIITPSSSMGG